MATSPTLSTDPAFPILNDKAPIGVTKREYFSALALQAILPSSSYNGKSMQFISTDATTAAVQFADALIAALNK